MSINTPEWGTVARLSKPVLKILERGELGLILVVTQWWMIMEWRSLKRRSWEAGFGLLLPCWSCRVQAPHGVASGQNEMVIEKEDPRG